MNCLIYGLLYKAVLAKDTATVKKSEVVPRFGYRLPSDLYADETTNPPGNNDNEDRILVQCPNSRDKLARVTCGDLKIKNIRWIRVGLRDLPYVTPCIDPDQQLKIECVSQISHRQHYRREDRTLVGQTLESKDIAVLPNFMMLCSEPLTASSAELECLTHTNDSLKCGAIMTTEVVDPTNSLAWICVNEFMLMPQLGYTTRLRLPVKDTL